MEHPASFALGEVYRVANAFENYSLVAVDLLRFLSTATQPDGLGVVGCVMVVVVMRSDNDLGF